MKKRHNPRVCAEVITLVHENPGLETINTITDLLMENKDESLRHNIRQRVRYNVFNLVKSGHIKFCADVSKRRSIKTNTPLVPREYDPERIVEEDDGDIS